MCVCQKSVPTKTPSYLGQELHGHLAQQRAGGRGAAAGGPAPVVLPLLVAVVPTAAAAARRGGGGAGGGLLLGQELARLLRQHVLQIVPLPLWW